MAKHAKLRKILVVGSLLTALTTLASPTLASVGATTSDSDILTPSTQFYVPKPNHDAVEQIAELTAQGDKADAAKIRTIINTPTAVWVESGSPKEAQQQVRQIVSQAADKQTLPVFVLYNIPFRDCAQYSAGGATSVAEYKAWIDGVARGTGADKAIFAVEPDGLGIIPHYTTINGNQEWCQPSEANAATAAAERFEMLNYAVDKLSALPNTKVYLDGTHDGWLGVGDATDRLIKAGVLKADGFFLNASNYRWTDRLEKYGAWISQCIELEQTVNWWNPAWCASQYYPANPSDFSTWALTDADYANRWTSLGVTPNPANMAHFIIDTSRNGQGPWTPPAGVYPDAQDWCNPPARGIGLRPTTATSSPLADAYVWIKVPGESDGQCSRGLGPTGTVDPEWGVVDPAAGVWFPMQALDLARRSNPALP